MLELWLFKTNRAIVATLGHAVFAIALLAIHNPVKAAAIDFDQYFAEGALRVDIVHSGRFDNDHISVRRILHAPYWPGAPHALANDPGRGKYRLEIAHQETGVLIFRRGFGTLFGEWQTTDEAKTITRAFEETLEFPLPKDPVVLRLLARTKKGDHEEIFSAEVDPSSHLIGATPLRTDAEVTDIEINGPALDKVDLLIIGDGYRVIEEEKFGGDCNRFLDNFFATEPFKKMRDRFNVRSVFVPARTSGIDEPRKNIFSDTPFGMTFSMFDLPRYCMTEDVWNIHDVAALAPHDAILLMANSSRYGGGAIYNFYTVFVSDNEYDDYLAVHEFGHGFVGLADEYYSASVAYNDFYPAGVEPDEPNITALLDPAWLKWRQFVDDTTPIPTPADNPEFTDAVGAFEGAGYAARGLYRPQKDCKMFSKGNRGFCRVCEQAVVDMIKFYAPK